MCILGARTDIKPRQHVYLSVSHTHTHMQVETRHGCGDEQRCGERERVSDHHPSVSETRLSSANAQLIFKKLFFKCVRSTLRVF